MGNEYDPDVVYPPGETLKELMGQHNVSALDVAIRVGFSLKTVHKIMDGNKVITRSIAAGLSQAFQTDSLFWLELERNYQEYVSLKFRHARGR